MSEWWINWWIFEIPVKNGSIKRDGKILEVTNKKDAMKEAMELIKTMNEKERTKGSKKRFVLNFYMELHRDIHLDGRNDWADEQTAKELFPNKECPK